jgi:hypothetical protein
MSTPPYVAPALQLPAFNCPRCHAYSKHYWQQTLTRVAGGTQEVGGLRIAQCAHCNRFSIWFNEHMLDPATTTAPSANPDLPEPLLCDYEEARAILPASPRGAAALMRLVIQKLCAELGQTGRDLNADIAALVKRGLDVRVQQALDVVRVIGNNAVHPGQIDVDDTATATQLFWLTNIIVDYTISQPKRIDQLYASLPEAQRKAIEQRDSRSRRDE